MLVCDYIQLSIVRNNPWLFRLVTRSSLSDVRFELTSPSRKGRCFTIKLTRLFSVRDLNPRPIVNKTIALPTELTEMLFLYLIGNPIRESNSLLQFKYWCVTIDANRIGAFFSAVFFLTGFYLIMRKCHPSQQLLRRDPSCLTMFHPPPHHPQNSQQVAGTLR